MKFLTAITAAAAVKVSHKSRQPGPMDHCEELLWGMEMMFEMMDSDGSGAISADEAIAFGVPEEDIYELGFLDSNGDGELSKDELVPVVNEVLDYYGCEGI